MKFGKYLQQQMLPEWSSHYMSYKGLKKIIKKAERTSDSAESQAFFYNLDRELEKVNAFYLEKETELKARFRLLHSKQKILTGKATKTSEALLNLQEAFMQFQHELIKLQNFVELNATGFRKILKKFDRRTKATTKEMYLSSHVEVQPCFNKEVLAELADQAAVQLVEVDAILRESSTYRITFEQWIQNADHLESDLMNAIQNDDLEQTKELAAKIAPLQAKGDVEWMQRALRKACSKGSLQCARFLLENGADARSVDEVSCRTCLHIACMAGHLEISQLLTEMGNSDLNVEDMHGRRAIHYAAMGGFTSIVRYLLSRKAVDLAIDQDGSTPLVYAVIRGHKKTVEAFLEQGTEGFEFETGKDPLALAAENGHHEIVEMLIKKGYHVNKLTLAGVAPLHLSCREGHLLCCRLLTQYGADLMLVDKYNQWTPIFYAASEGHIECVKILLSTNKCRLDVYDESGWTPWQHALYGGHIETAELLKLPNLSSLTPSKMSPEKQVDLDLSQGNDLDMSDAIPSLELPPPMIPCKIYGHSYLEKKIQVQIKLGAPNSKPKRRPLVLYDSRQSASLKINISVYPNNDIPHTVILPLEDEQEVFTFETSSLDSFNLAFDILPTFGSKTIGRAVALPTIFTSTCSGVASLAVMDRFDLVGEIWFEYVVIRPFAHPSMAIAGKVQTYWKSTSTVSKPDPSGVYPKKEKTSSAMITASSLAKEYIMLTVQVTKDGVPVICDQSLLEGIGFDLTVADITLAQFLMLPSPQWLKDIQAAKGPAYNEFEEKMKILESGTPALIHQIHISLQDLLKFAFPSVGICLDITFFREESQKYSQKARTFDFNQYVDAILRCIYDHAGTRSLMLSSTDPGICLMCNLKQPNYPVFFQTSAGLKKSLDARCNSIDQGVRFAKGANLLGIVCDATPLVQVPNLITTIKAAGLVLATFGPANGIPANIALQEKFDVDAVVYEGSIRVKRHVEWF